MLSVMNMDNPVYRAYLFYSGVLALKMLFMTVLTARQRFAKNIFVSPEDTTLRPKSKVGVHEDIERVRRAHLNDLENVPLFFVTAFLYMSTNPAPWLAINLYRAYTFGRIAHTLVYAVVVVPQPARVIAFGISYVISIFMAVSAIVAFY